MSFLIDYWDWIRRAIMLVLVFLFMYYVPHRIKGIKFKRKDWRNTIAFSLLVFLSFIVISIASQYLVYAIHQPEGYSTFKTVDLANLPLETVEEISDNIIKFDMTYVIPLEIILFLCFSVFLLKKFYKMELKNSFKLSIFLVIFFYVFDLILIYIGAMIWVRQFFS